MGLLKDTIILNPTGSTEGYAAVVNEAKAEYQLGKDGNTGKPEIPFRDIFYLVDHDSRLSLGNDTYVELVLGTGMTISGENKKTIELVEKWLLDILWAEKLEDGLQSYFKAGQMMFSKAKLFANINEIDLRTIDRAESDKKGHIEKYVQKVNNKEIDLNPDDIIHFRLNKRAGDVWGKPLANSILMPRFVDGRERQSPVEDMWEVENAMVKIFKSYASPMMMIHFEDAGETFIKKIEKKMKKAGQGSKIITDKKFDAKVFEVNPASKFDKYIEHLEKDVIETGTQFASQMLTAGFTARASSESASDVIKLKIKRHQNRLANQIKMFMIDPFLVIMKKDPKKEKITVAFQLESEEAISITDVQGLFEKGTLKRSEVRKHINKNTNIEIDIEDMEDDPPITSVTPTNDMGKPAEPQGTTVTIPRESLDKLISVISEKLPTPRGRPKDGDQEKIDVIKMKVLEKLLNDRSGDDIL